MNAPLHKITAFPLSTYCADGGGVINANGDYSAVPKTFFIQPGATQDFVIRKISIHFTIASTQMVYNDYANIAGGLANGITVQSYGSSVIHDLTQGHPLKVNDDFIHLGTGIETFAYSGNVTSITASLDLDGVINAPLTLKGENSEQLQFLLNDNFLLLIDHSFVVQGYINDSAGYR